MRSFIGRRFAGLTKQGHKRLVLPLIAAIRFVRPRDRRLAEFHAKVLIAPPATMAEIERAIEVVSRSLRRSPTQRGGSVLADAILVMASHDGSAASVRAAVGVLDEVEIRLAFPGLRSLANGLIDRGHSASSFVLELMSGVDHRGATEFVHTSLLRSGDIDAAAELAAKNRHWHWMTDSVFAGLEAERALAGADPAGALACLESVKPERPSAFSRRYVVAASAAGAYDRVFDYLGAYVHNLSPVAEAQFRFEAHWALGQADEAVAALAGARAEDPLNILLLRLEQRALALQHDDAADQLAERLRALEGELVEPTMNDVTALIAAFYQLECLDDIERIAASMPDELLGPASRVHLARTRYVLRDFDGALAALRPLHGSWWRWDGEKLAARIRLEMGDAAEALEMRAHRRPDSALDEVEFHALLSLHRYEEAFRLYLPPADVRRLQKVFPETSQVSGPLERVDHRVIIMQSGPGDEIMLSSLYAKASEQSERLSVTCEPRLEGLLRQSFPSIEFLPVRRLKPNEFGWRRDEPDRAEAGPLAAELNAKALEVAKAADSVVMGRSLPLVLGSAGLPAARYLRPSSDALARVAGLRRERPLLGVVWRSEMRSPIRNIHYLGVCDLQRLLPDGIDVVCLQHDVADDERMMIETLADSIVDLADIDLRNDFDVAAAVASVCDIVVGIGTTMIELAGAVGTPTVMIQPTHFGTWRARSGTDQDYWHESMVVSAVPEPWDRESLIAKARLQIDEILSLL